MKINYGSPPVKPSGLLLWKRRVSAKFNRALKEQKLTIQEVAFKTRLPLRFLEKVQKGEFYPSHKARTLLEKALHLDPGTLER